VRRRVSQLQAASHGAEVSGPGLTVGHELLVAMSLRPLQAPGRGRATRISLLNALLGSVNAAFANIELRSAT